MTTWNRFSYDTPTATGPRADGTYWVVEEFYSPDEPSIAFFESGRWTTITGSGDCSITWWAEIDYPPMPTEETR